MKLFEVSQMSPESIIRNSLGRTLSARGIAIVLSRAFGQDFSIMDVTPYTRSINQALKNVNPYDRDALDNAKDVWLRAAAEIAHPKKRTLPINDE